MTNYLKNVLIGIFVISAGIIVIGIVMFLKPSVGDGKKILNVRFSNISGINVGTRVTFAGKAVGEVESISQVPDAREQPTDMLDRVYFYQLKLKVDSSVKVYNTDEITTSTSGLMGEKGIAIIPKAPKKGQIPKLITSQVIYAKSVDPLESALHDISTLAKQAQTTIKDITQWFDENSDNLSQAVAGFSGSMHELETLLDTINTDNIVGSSKKALDLFSDNLELIRTTLEEVQKNGLIATIDDVFKGFDETIKSFNVDGRQILNNLNVITSDLADGSGTLGQLITNDDLYLRINNVTSKVETFLNDVNQYGVLFQYNKQWQRLRTKRVTEMNALESPSEFRQYTQKEIDLINTALGRISMVLDKADDQDQKLKIIKSAAFKKDFFQLLKQVQGLSNTLKLYNEQILKDINCE